MYLHSLLLDLVWYYGQCHLHVRIVKAVRDRWSKNKALKHKFEMSKENSLVKNIQQTLNSLNCLSLSSKKKKKTIGKVNFILTLWRSSECI